MLIPIELYNKILSYLISIKDQLSILNLSKHNKNNLQLIPPYPQNDFEILLFPEDINNFVSGDCTANYKLKLCYNIVYNIINEDANKYFSIKFRFVEKDIYCYKSKKYKKDALYFYGCNLENSPEYINKFDNSKLKYYVISKNKFDSKINSIEYVYSINIQSSNCSNQINKLIDECTLELKFISYKNPNKINRLIKMLKLGFTQ